MPAPPKDLRSPQVITPSTDRLDVPGDCDLAADLKNHIERTTGIPASLQRLYRRGHELAHDEPIGEDDLDLVLVLGSAYTVSRRELTPVTNEIAGEPLHPARSEAARRDPQVMSWGVRIRHPEEVRTFNHYHLATEKSRSFREAWLDRRPRRLAVLKAIAARLKGRTIVTSVFNEGFTPLLRNWAASCDRHGIDPRTSTLLFPTDEEANAAAVELGFATLFDAESVRQVPNEGAAVYGDERFRATVMCKPAIVADLLELGRDVLFQDIDMVWFTDPIVELSRLATHDALDALFMNDGPNGRFVPRHYNSGFFYIRNNPFTRRVWHDMLRAWPAVFMFRSDQALLNLAIPHFESRGLRTAPLDDQRFVNGHVLVKHERLGLSQPPNPAVIHLSWTGHLGEKIEKMKRLGYWYLDETVE